MPEISYQNPIYLYANILLIRMLGAPMLANTVMRLL